MAIALDTVTQASATATSPLTWSHVCTGSNLYLVVVVAVTNEHPPAAAIAYVTV